MKTKQETNIPPKLPIIITLLQAEVPPSVAVMAFLQQSWVLI